ncbi:MAG: 5-(carboxyamino)imidazole ribonucleotide mutase [Elusimicrobiota bacterium]
MADKVTILMGSDSDLPVMRQAAEELERFGVGYRMTVASAHRTPEHVRDCVRRAEEDGVTVFICGAGGAAHLAGAVAALTIRPVIGVPLGSKLSGFDSLLSTAQMPRGVPVAAVAVDGAANAGILAVQILALSEPKLAEALRKDKQSMAQKVLRKAKNLA